MNVRIDSFEEYKKQYDASVDNPDRFWGDIAQTFTWQKPYTQVCEWDFEGPDIKWFVDGQMNITENCLDRHLEKRGNKLALIWEPNDPKERAVRLTYRELHDKVCQAANGLKELGFKRVTGSSCICR